MLYANYMKAIIPVSQCTLRLKSTASPIHGALYVLGTSCLVLMHVKYSKTRIDVSM